MNQIFGLLPQVRADIQLALGFVIAVIITIHVLRTKREVTAAVGWIGLAWVSPFFGGFAYFVLGINRVRRRAARMRGGAPVRVRGTREAREMPGEDVHLRPLQKGIGFITARPPEPGCSISILHNGDEAYPAMLEAIAAARHSVGLSSYIMRDDEIGRQFVEALKAAQARGVQVRAIVDGVGSGWLLTPIFRRLCEAGVPARRFLHSPMPWRMPFLNLRMHTKILVVDGRVGFTGGVNIADQNRLATNPADPVQDTHFRIEGPVMGQLTDVFASDWSFVSDETLDGPDWFPDLDTTGPVTARVITAGPDQDLEKVEFAILQAIACARTSVQIMTPYFLPDQQLVTALSLAAMRGVAVDVVVPQLSDRRMIDWAMHANVGPLLKDGVRVWRSPPPFRHSKVMVVDGEWCLIGSSNWDMRSLRLNFETCVELYDRDIAAELEALMRSYRGNALVRSELARRSLPARLRDSAIRLMLPYL